MHKKNLEDYSKKKVFKDLSKKKLSSKKVNLLKKNKVLLWIQKKLAKNNLIYLCLSFIDALLIIYFARKNAVNYVQIAGEEIFISKTRYLLLGRNYINLIVTFFFFGYTLVLQRFFFKRKITVKYFIGILLFYFILNVILFYIFTKRIY